VPEPDFEDALGPEPADEAPGSPTIEAAHFRSVLGHYATGVTIITAEHDGKPYGLAANSFTSVSLDPPLVSFCAAHTSSTWPHIKAAGHFCVNILGAHQEELCRLFAMSGADKFAGVGYSQAATGAPVIADVIGFLDCMIEAEHEAGDHVIVVGRVHDLDINQEGKPLLFFRGGYGRFDA
jgi:3-hydroxy-9,10-secoandrosta-1,3,5(10)-triene-9,17-dione monooxygenase reductase component